MEKTNYIPNCSYGQTPLTREYFEKNNWIIRYTKHGNYNEWSANLQHECNDECCGIISLSVTNSMYSWRFAINGMANGKGEGYFSGQVFVCTVEELEMFLFNIVHIGWDYRTKTKIE